MSVGKSNSKALNVNQIKVHMVLDKVHNFLVLYGSSYRATITE